MSYNFCVKNNTILRNSTFFATICHIATTCLSYDITKITEFTKNFKFISVDCYAGWKRIGRPCGSSAGLTNEIFTMANDNVISLKCILFYKDTGKLDWSSICLGFSQFEPQIICLMVCLISKLISWSDIVFDMRLLLVESLSMFSMHIFENMINNYTWTLIIWWKRKIPFHASMFSSVTLFLLVWSILFNVKDWLVQIDCVVFSFKIYFSFSFCTDFKMDATIVKTGKIRGLKQLFTPVFS